MRAGLAEAIRLFCRPVVKRWRTCRFFVQSSGRLLQKKRGGWARPRRPALLPQPGGFEGEGTVRESFPAHDLAAPQGPEGPEVPARLDAALVPTSADVCPDQHRGGRSGAISAFPPAGGGTWHSLHVCIKSRPH